MFFVERYMNAEINIIVINIMFNFSKYYPSLMQLISMTDHDVMCFLLQNFNNPVHFRQFEP